MRDKDSGIYATDGRPFDYPLTAVDSRRWQRLGELSIEEAAFVVAGFEPPPIEVIRFKPIQYQERPGKTWAQPQDYDDFVLAAERALERNQLAGRSDIQMMFTVRLVELPTVLRWARERSFTVASMWDPFEQDVQAAPPVPVVEDTSNEPTPAPQESHVGQDETLDLSILADPGQMIDAFGRYTNMDKSWFDKWADNPVLNNAIMRKGTSGRGHTTEPLFCPFLVMQGLMTKPRISSKRKPFLNDETPWRMLKRHFAPVYDLHRGESPLDD
jgi:hypothetical protein